MTSRLGPSVWDEIASFSLPVLVVHQHSGQPDSCLDGLIQYACSVAQNKHTYSLLTPKQILSWLWRQPVIPDTGHGPRIDGCNPKQSFRIWPDDGLNCWDAVAHLLGVAFAFRWLLEFHIYDAFIGSQRHVFPAIRPLCHFHELPIPLVIQPPMRRKVASPQLIRTMAQAWYNDILGGVHIVGDKVLRVFGVGELADTMADLEGDALPDWARTAKQKEKRAAELINRATEASKTEQAANKTDAIQKQNSGKEASASVAEDIAALKKQVADLANENRTLRSRLNTNGKGA